MTSEVHIEWQGQIHLVGRLYSNERGPSVAFEYAPEWLLRPDTFAIDPTALPLRRGPQHGKSLFGAIQDCGPDRWGRVLIERAVRKKVLPQKPYHEMDYVIALEDTSRVGALRFRAQADGPFLAVGSGKLPPMLRLGALLHATEAIHNETETAEDLRYLLGKGSPLGGARPKSSIILPDGRLAIAKFPRPDDTRDIATGEILALTLAQQAGVQVAGHRLVTVDKRNVAVITRFDRDGQARVPFLSASSLLGLPPGEEGSYTMVADAIRRFGHDVAGDLRELWRRLAFSLLAGNYDDHLRNHGFLMRASGRWSLSPAYDLNPVPEIDRTSVNKTPITEDQEQPSVDLMLSAAPRFGLGAGEARKVLSAVFFAVSRWRETGRSLRLGKKVLDAYASAFEQPLMAEAGKLLGR